MIWFLLPLAGAQDTFFVNVRSTQWNVVFRSSPADTRIERMAARCGAGWVNVCASWVMAPQRQRAMQAGLTPTTRVLGSDYTSCQAIRLPRMDPPVLQRSVLQADARAFCEVLKPGSTGMADGLRSAPVGSAAPLAPPRSPGPPLPARTTGLGGAPPATTTSRGATFTPPPPRPAPRPLPPDPPTMTTAASMEEFRLLDLDGPAEPIAPSREEDDKKKKRKKQDDEPVLKKRSLPR